MTVSPVGIGLVLVGVAKWFAYNSALLMQPPSPCYAELGQIRKKLFLGQNLINGVLVLDLVMFFDVSAMWAIFYWDKFPWMV